MALLECRQCYRNDDSVELSRPWVETAVGNVTARHVVLVCCPTDMSSVCFIHRVAGWPCAKPYASGC